jgi:tetratricopeptide (TPR) repeat protein
LYQDALNIARAIGDEYAALTYRTNLAAALIDVGENEAALAALQQTLALAENVSRVVSWIDRHEVYQYLAQVYLARGNVDAALTAAQETLALLPRFRHTAVSGAVWRTLGQIAAWSGRAVGIDGEGCTAVTCFQKSLHHLQEQPGGLGIKREQVLTLRAWADYAAQQGDEPCAADLCTQAKTLAAQLGIE